MNVNLIYYAILFYFQRLLKVDYRRNNVWKYQNKKGWEVVFWWSRQCSSGIMYSSIRSVEGLLAMKKQECIPVGCVPSASVAVSRGGGCLPGGCLPKGCLLGRGICLGGVSTGGASAWGRCLLDTPPPRDQNHRQV